jgi:hypothetical protein
MVSSVRLRVARFLRIALPLAAAGIIVVIFTFPRPEFGRRIGFDDVDFDLGEGLRLTNPRFTGSTADGRPFVVTADWALPDGPDPERIGLGPVTGEIRLDDARAVRLAAAGGEIRPKAETLRLEGGVAVDTSDGWRLTVSSATLDMAANVLTGEGPVAGSGPSGGIEAGSLRAARTAEGDYIWFEGGVRVRFDPARAREAGAADGEAN